MFIKNDYLEREEIIILLKLSKKGKGETIKKPSNEKPPELKMVSAKQADRLIQGVVGGVVILNIALVILIASGYKPTQKVVHVSDDATKATTNASVDWQAKVYLDGFVKSYFNFPEEEKAQEKTVKALNTYYGQPLPVISQGQVRKPSKFKNATLMRLTNDEATYKVSYSAGKTTTKTVKKGRGTTKQNIVTYHDETTMFTVPYIKAGSSYYVSDQPYFISLQDLQANVNQIPTKTFSDADDNKPSVKKALDKFTKSLFTAYTTDGDTLKLISDGLTLNTSEKFKSLDQSVYKAKGNTYEATVQVTMENALGTHVENYRFIIEKQKQSYFATEFKHTLPEGKTNE